MVLVLFKFFLVDQLNFYVWEYVHPILEVLGIVAAAEDLRVGFAGDFKAREGEAVAQIVEIERIGANDRMAQRAEKRDIAAEQVFDAFGGIGVIKGCGGDFHCAMMGGVWIKVTEIKIFAAIKVTIKEENFFNLCGEANIAAFAQIAINPTGRGALRANRKCER